MASLKFLVVDDASFIRDLLKKNLRDNFPGCTVFDAASAKKAQVLLKTNRVDLILCDWEMPEMTGEEFLRWIRAEQDYTSLPFIMVTSRGERDFIIKAVEAGASDYLGKPFKPESLVAKVTKALHKVGKKAKTANSGSDGLVQASGSAGVLMSGTTQPKAKENKSQHSNSVNVLMGGGESSAISTTASATPKSKSGSKAKSKAARGQAQLNFADFKALCVINDISLQMLRGAIKREESLPSVFDSVVISIVQNDGDDVARLNGYVHSVEAGENRIDAGVVKITIRFVDEDADKLEHLSRYIAKL